MNNLNDIFNSDFFQTNIQTQMDADDKHLEQHGWTREEIQSIADSVTKKELELLNGNQLAKLLNKLDLQGREEDAILVESEMDFRYEYWFKSKLIESNK